MYILSLFWLSFFCYLYIMPNIHIPQIMSVFSLYLLFDALMTVYLGQLAFYYLPPSLHLLATEVLY